MQSVINMRKLQKIESLNKTSRTNVGEFIYTKHIIGLLLSAYFLLFIYPKTGLDQTLIAPYFDAATHSFPLKHQFFLENFMHIGLRYCMIFIAIASLWAGLQASIHEPYRASIFNKFSCNPEQQFIWVFAAMLLSTSTVSYLKSISIHGCPSDLTLYGGELPILALFERLPAGVVAGHCFPGGHASGGFALMAFYFAFKETKPKLAKMGLFGGLVIGFAMGWAQMMRGEHFLSHNLWTAWVVWLVLFVLFTLKNQIEKNK